MSDGRRSPLLSCMLLAASAGVFSGAPAILDAAPLWAYGFTTEQGVPDPAAKPREDETARSLHRLRHIPDSAEAFSLAELRDGHRVADWFPGDHPPMTPILVAGPASLGQKAMGCAYCHLPNGLGKPENAPVAGLPEPYIARQLHDMQQGLRRSSDPRKANTELMIVLARAMTEAEIQETARYFSGLPRRRWIRVVETASVPRCSTESGMFYPEEGAGSEPIGARLMEVPEDWRRTRLRDPHSGFVAYVPRGSVALGRALVETGAVPAQSGQAARTVTVACATCHGPGLNGQGELPPLSGRSPSYLARQLYDIQGGSRRGSLSAPMLPVVANLSEADILAICAYIASLEPAPPAKSAAAAPQG